MINYDCETITPPASGRRLYIHAARTYAAALAESDPLREAEAWAYLNYLAHRYGDVRISNEGHGKEPIIVRCGIYMGTGLTVRLAVEDLQCARGESADWDCPVEELLI